VVGICITLDGRQYRDDVDLTAEEFYSRMGETISHKTAAPSVGDWLDAMQAAVDARRGRPAGCDAARTMGPLVDAAVKLIRPARERLWTPRR
jgi:Uncharacterised protein, DegV family COG1307